MNLREYKILIFVVTAISALIVASPALQRLLVYPQTEYFTEFWYLGPKHMAEDIPYNITKGESYNIFLGISNNLQQVAYYQVQIKFRNQYQSAPNNFNHTYSTLEPLYTINAIVAYKETWELPITFSFDYSYDSYSSQINFNRLTFNREALNLSNYSTSWDAEKKVFYGNLIFELWIYNETTNTFQYHERYVDLKLNMLT